MRQALGPGALGKPRGSGWRGRGEGGSGWGTHVNPWLFHSNVKKIHKIIERQNNERERERERERETRPGCAAESGNGFIFHHRLYTLSWYISKGQINTQT